MNIFWAIVLGVVQGLTEFFPVSSSAHLTILPWIFRFKDPGLSFDIALHAGTMVAILVALWTDWYKLLLGLFQKGKSFEKKLILFLLLTSVPGAIFGYLLENYAKSLLRNPLLIAITLSIFGFVLFMVDRKSNDKKKTQELNARSALGVGFAQAAAIIPGISRSGATITALRFLGFSREDTVRYSFMAALPIIFGATVFGLRKTTLPELLSPVWVVGFLTALGASYWAIKYFITFSKKQDFRIFYYYRLAFSALIVIILLLRG